MWRLRETGDPVDVVIISPEPGLQKEIGQRLLALATSPYDVQWVTWPQAGFSVPLELFQAFDADGDDTDSDAEAEETPKRRKRRSKTSTDNNTSEEE